MNLAAWCSGCDSPGCAPMARAAHQARPKAVTGEPRHFDEVRSTVAYICRGKPCQKLPRNAFAAGQTCHQKGPCPTLLVLFYPGQCLSIPSNENQKHVIGRLGWFKLPSPQSIHEEGCQGLVG